MTEGRNAPRIDAAEILEGIRRWIEIESPSNDGAAVNRMVEQTEGEMRDIGVGTERTPGRDGFGDILIARSPWGGDGPGILVLSHLDTVHPIGMLERLPFERKGDKVYGPGIYDMKGGAYLAYYAFRHLIREGKTTKLPITFLFVPEEEVGSPTSRATIEAEAKKNKYVLVTEPARDGGKIVTARKGNADFTVRTEGRPAHAGLRHQDGRNAIKEMAHQILTIEAMTDYERGVTLSVGTIAGGTGRNVVPQYCEVLVDMRCPDPEIMDEMAARMHALSPIDPDVKVTVEGGVSRPPYVKDAGIAALFDHAKSLAAEIGFELEDVPMTGGCSDANFTAALGIPTLDGLGVDGHGAHTDYEHMLYSSLEPRARLLQRLFETLD
ncbi:MAG: M20 family metallopeptidase [Rhodospirillaceae bacterium]|jgi:glutamate carboxypeptidase|nr:M20 family metallopeptidase [Rhodospirillaceae bacterium]MBT5414381.1 M20 family metallopeptidase [Rhodospirillaceae bacterium]MBT6116445.1 M20 family metallopeptidase [Rhodospirillaceae bacterium]